MTATAKVQLGLQRYVEKFDLAHSIMHIAKSVQCHVRHRLENLLDAFASTGVLEMSKMTYEVHST